MPEPVATQATQAPVTLSLMIGPWSGDGDEVINMDTHVFRLVSKALAMNFDIIQVADTALADKLSLKLATNDLPDVMIAEAPSGNTAGDLAFVNEYGHKGAFLPLDQYIKHVYLRWMYDLGNTFPHAVEFAAAITTACKEAYTLQKSVKQALDGAADAHNALLTQYAGELKQFLADQA